MKCDICGGLLHEEAVTYRIDVDGKLLVVENVPAKVCGQCGEKIYSADTVEKLQKTIWEQKRPTRVMETPVFDYGES